MTIKELKSCVDQCAKKAGKTAATAKVEIWLGDKMYTIKEVRQFGVVPDMSITIEKPPAIGVLASRPV